MNIERFHAFALRSACTNDILCVQLKFDVGYLGENCAISCIFGNDVHFVAGCRRTSERLAKRMAWKFNSNLSLSVSVLCHGLSMSSDLCFGSDILDCEVSVAAFDHARDAI